MKIQLHQFPTSPPFLASGKDQAPQSRANSIPCIQHELLQKWQTIEHDISMPAPLQRKYEPSNTVYYGYSAATASEWSLRLGDIHGHITIQPLAGPSM